MHSFWKTDRPENKFLEWKDQFGNIYTYYLGPLAFVAVVDYQTAVDMFVKDGNTYEDRITQFESFLKLTRGGDFGKLL